jgi:hypothetical protein
MKDCLIITNQNAITYKEVFPLLKNNILFQGNTKPKEYIAPDGSVIKSGDSIWFTTFLVIRTKPLAMTKCYAGREDKYPVYDNYDAIEIGHYTKKGKWEGSLDELPSDYDGVMGVPITFLDKYNPEQFEIIGGSANGQVSDEYKIAGFDVYNNPIMSGKKIYQRIFIRRKN